MRRTRPQLLGCLYRNHMRSCQQDTQQTLHNSSYSCVCQPLRLDCVCPWPHLCLTCFLAATCAEVVLRMFMTVEMLLVM